MAGRDEHAAHAGNPADQGNAVVGDGTIAGLPAHDPRTGQRRRHAAGRARQGLAGALVHLDGLRRIGQRRRVGHPAHVDLAVRPRKNLRLERAAVGGAVVDEERVGGHVGRVERHAVALEAIHARQP